MAGRANSILFVVGNWKYIRTNSLGALWFFCEARWVRYWVQVQNMLILSIHVHISFVFLFLSCKGAFTPFYDSFSINFNRKRLSTYWFVYGDKQVPGFEHGNFIGPTILSGVTADMECYKVLFNFFFFCCDFGDQTPKNLNSLISQVDGDVDLKYRWKIDWSTLHTFPMQEEIFGPVLLCMEVGWIPFLFLCAN